ncbi:MAG: tetratricopeptide repeat protein, partial [Synechococcales cyanobacterium CRU_2_2]|nr:tetratricopeptide repeat protein [Synechococcales cyanobacterium CRU_2_2]
MVGIAKTIEQEVTVGERGRLVEAVPHLEEVAARWTGLLEGIDKCWCSNGLGRFYQSSGQWVEAERCCERSLEISKAELGDRHPDTA